MRPYHHSLQNESYSRKKAMFSRIDVMLRQGLPIGGVGDESNCNYMQLKIMMGILLLT